MTAKQRREAARKWLADPMNSGVSSKDIRSLALRFRANMRLTNQFEGCEPAAEELAKTLFAAARIRAREEEG